MNLEGTWAEKLRALRAIKGWTQNQAAKNCGTTQKTISLWEKEKSLPHVNSRKAIADAYGVTVEDIFP